MRSTPFQKYHIKQNQCGLQFTGLRMVQNRSNIDQNIGIFQAIYYNQMEPEQFSLELVSPQGRLPYPKGWQEILKVECLRQRIPYTDTINQFYGMKNWMTLTVDPWKMPLLMPDCLLNIYKMLLGGWHHASTYQNEIWLSRRRLFIEEFERKVLPPFPNPLFYVKWNLYLLQHQEQELRVMTFRQPENKFQAALFAAFFEENDLWILPVLSVSSLEHLKPWYNKRCAAQDQPSRAVLSAIEERQTWLEHVALIDYVREKDPQLFAKFNFASFQQLDRWEILLRRYPIPPPDPRLLIRYKEQLKHRFLHQTVRLIKGSDVYAVVLDDASETIYQPARYRSRHAAMVESVKTLETVYLSQSKLNISFAALNEELISLHSRQNFSALDVVIVEKVVYGSAALAAHLVPQYERDVLESQRQFAQLSAIKMVVPVANRISVYPLVEYKNKRYYVVCPRCGTSIQETSMEKHFCSAFKGQIAPVASRQRPMHGCIEIYRSNDSKRYGVCIGCLEVITDLNHKELCPNFTPDLSFSLATTGQLVALQIIPKAFVLANTVIPNNQPWRTHMVEKPSPNPCGMMLKLSFMENYFPQDSCPNLRLTMGPKTLTCVCTAIDAGLCIGVYSGDALTRDIFQALQKREGKGTMISSAVGLFPIQRYSPLSYVVNGEEGFNCAVFPIAEKSLTYPKEPGKLRFGLFSIRAILPGQELIVARRSYEVKLK